MGSSASLLTSQIAHTASASRCLCWARLWWGGGRKFLFNCPVLGLGLALGTGRHMVPLAPSFWVWLPRLHRQVASHCVV